MENGLYMDDIPRYTWKVNWFSETSMSELGGLSRATPWDVTLPMLDVDVKFCTEQEISSASTVWVRLLMLRVQQFKVMFISLMGFSITFWYSFENPTKYPKVVTRRQKPKHKCCGSFFFPHETYIAHWTPKYQWNSDSFAEKTMVVGP